MPDKCALSCPTISANHKVMKGAHSILLLLLLGLLLPGIFPVQAADKIDINTAPAEELIKIKYIGEKRAQELISLRPFCSLDELTKIKGIAEKTLAAIKEQGLAWVDPNRCRTESQPKESEPLGQTDAQTQPAEEMNINTESQQRSQQTGYPSGIFINELLPAPEGSDDKQEWIEILNSNNFAADLSDWQIQDTIGSIKTYTFPAGASIGPNAFLVLSRPTTGITLNNDGDGVRLLLPNGTIADQIAFGKALIGQSYNRTQDEWAWSTILTPGSANIVPAIKGGGVTEPAAYSAESAVIDINTAPLEDLVRITHIGETRANELISLRPFYSLDDLTKIKGIGDKALEDIKQQGLAWVDPTLKPQEATQDQGAESLAALTKPLEQGNSGSRIPVGLIIFLAASGIAFFSSTALVIIKRSLRTNDIP